MGQKSDNAYSASITLTFVLFLSLLQTSPLTPQQQNTSEKPMNGMYIVYQGSLLSAGAPNSVAERIVDAKNLYGFPQWIEVTTAYPYGEINNTLVDYFHAADIDVSARVWSDGGNNPLSTIKSQIDQVLAWAPNVDMIMIDECNGNMYSYLQTLSSYVHNKGKLIAFNMAGYEFDESFISLADHITTEFWWRGLIANHSDWLITYPGIFAGQVNDWGYDFLGYPSIQVDLARAISDTQEAWNAGLPYFFATSGEGFTLPTWYEDYLQALAQVQTPTFNPSSGVYGVAQNVTISSATSGATLYYTDDGSTPTVASTEYTAPVEVATSKTLKALGVKAYYTNSAVGSASYTINNPVTPSAAAVRAYLAMLRRR